MADRRRMEVASKLVVQLMKILFACFLALTVVACQRYQLVEVANDVYKIDTASGDVWVLEREPLV